MVEGASVPGRVCTAERRLFRSFNHFQKFQCHSFSKCTMTYLKHKRIVATFALKMFKRAGVKKGKTVSRKEEQLFHEGEVGHGLKLS